MVTETLHGVLMDASGDEETQEEQPLVVHEGEHVEIPFDGIVTQAGVAEDLDDYDKIVLTVRRSASTTPLVARAIEAAKDKWIIQDGDTQGAKGKYRYDVFAHHQADNRWHCVVVDSKFTIADAQFDADDDVTNSGPSMARVGVPTVAAGDLYKFLNPTDDDPFTLAWRPFALANIISPTALGAGSSNNYAPTGHADASAMRISPSAAHTLTGLTASAIGGKVVLVQNIGAAALTLAHESASSTAANRFLCLGSDDAVVGVGGSAWLWYDPTSTRWRVFVGGASGAGSDITEVATIAERDALTGVVDGDVVRVTGQADNDEYPRGIEWVALANDPGPFEWTIRGYQILDSLNPSILDVNGAVRIGFSGGCNEWEASTAYTEGEKIINASRLYKCITSGTSAGAGGPTTTSADITDGTAHWKYLGESFAMIYSSAPQVAETSSSDTTAWSAVDQGTSSDTFVPGFKDGDADGITMTCPLEVEASVRITVFIKHLWRAQQ